MRCSDPLVAAVAAAGGQSAPRLPLRPVCLCLLFHLLEPVVIIRELIEVCKRNLRRQEKVVVGDVRHRVVEACSGSTTMPRLNCSTSNSSQVMPKRSPIAFASPGR